MSISDRIKKFFVKTPKNGEKMQGLKMPDFRDEGSSLGASMVSKIVVQAKAYLNLTLKDWRNATEAAQDTKQPRRADLYEVYERALQDLHTASEIQVRTQRVLGYPYSFTDKKGNPQTSPINTQVLRLIITYVMDSIYWGHSLMEFAFSKGATAVELVPREHVVPEQGLILAKPYDKEGFAYRDTSLGRFILEAGETHNLGLLHPISNHVLRKNGMEKAWLEFGQRFGLPIPYATSTLNNPTDIAQIDGFLSNISNGTWGRFPQGVTIDFVEASHTDSYEIFLKYIELKNAEISKAILGQTMLTNDNGVGSYSKAEVSERVAEDILKADRVYIANFVNTQLLPFLQTHGIPTQNLTFVWDDASRLPIMEQWKIDSGLMAMGYTFPLEYLLDVYGAPVIPPKAQPIQPNTVKANFQTLPFTAAQKEAYMLSTPKQEETPAAADTLYYNVTELAETFEKMLRELWEGKIDKGQAYNQFRTALALYYNEGVTEGYGVIYGMKDVRMMSFLRKNVFLFSGAKSYFELTNLRDLLTDDEGNYRSWNDFKQAAQAINDTHNLNYLQAEYTQAIASAQMASKWTQIRTEAEVLPLLKYDAINDDRTRPEHAALDGIIRPVTDDFWQTYYPPNGWGCRCSVRQLDDSHEATPLPESLPELKPIFRNNVGKNGIVFLDTHPYYSDIPKNTWENIADKMGNAYEMDLYRKVKENDKGNFIEVHPDYDRTDYTENLQYADWLLKAGYNVRIRPHSFEQGTKNPETWVQLPDGEWVLGDFKRFKPHKATDKGEDFIQKAIKSAREQGANLPVVLLNNPHTTLNNLRTKLRACFQKGHNETVFSVILIYNDTKELVYLTRKEIQDWSFVKKIRNPNP